MGVGVEQAKEITLLLESHDGGSVVPVTAAQIDCHATIRFDPLDSRKMTQVVTRRGGRHVVERHLNVLALRF